MNDNHTFRQIWRKDLPSIMAEADELRAKNKGGCLCAVIILNDDDSEARRVGKNVHARSESWRHDLVEWAKAIQLDPDAEMLIRNRKSP